MKLIHTLLLLVLARLVTVLTPPDGRSDQRRMVTIGRRVYLDAKGQVVEADNPDRASLLIAAGGQMAYDDALRYGLIDADGTEIPPGGQGDEADEPEPAPARPATKRKVAAPENKARVVSNPDKAAGTESPPAPDADDDKPASS